jgi:hypothetical protein
VLSVIGVARWAEQVETSDLLLSAISLPALKIGILLIERRDASRNASCRPGSTSMSSRPSPSVCCPPTPPSLAQALSYICPTPARCATP